MLVATWLLLAVSDHAFMVRVFPEVDALTTAAKAEVAVSEITV
jgi:hypothetical protein